LDILLEDNLAMAARLSAACDAAAVLDARCEIERVVQYDVAARRLPVTCDEVVCASPRQPPRACRTAAVDLDLLPGRSGAVGGVGDLLMLVRPPVDLGGVDVASDGQDPAVAEVVDVDELLPELAARIALKNPDVLDLIDHPIAFR